MATRAETERKKERSGEALETVLATLGTLTDEDLAALHMRVGQALDDRDLDAMAGHWDYERHTWGRAVPHEEHTGGRGRELHPLRLYIRTVKLIK
ncbi:MAG: hypothetical protein ACR2GU_03685 [Rubrobacteraceae bacterium]